MTDKCDKSMEKFKLVPGVQCSLWSSETLDGFHFAQVAQVGFKAVEISRYNNRTHHLNINDTRHVRRLGRAASDEGIAVWSIHSSDNGDFSTGDKASRQSLMNELKLCLDAADILGAKIVVSHLQCVGKGFDDLANAEKYLAEAMHELEPIVRASGARIAIENGYACRPGLWTRDIFKRVDPFPADVFGYVWDTGHSNVAGDLEDIETGLGNRLISTHLNDNVGRDNHMAPGLGNIDWKRIAKAVKGTGYDGCLLWEVGASFNPMKDDPLLLHRIMEGHNRFMEYWNQA